MQKCFYESCLELFLVLKAWLVPYFYILFSSFRLHLCSDYTNVWLLLVGLKKTFLSFRQTGQQQRESAENPASIKFAEYLNCWVRLQTEKELRNLSINSAIFLPKAKKSENYSKNVENWKKIRKQLKFISIL